MNISGFKHTLEGALSTYDPNILEKLKNRDFLLSEFEKQGAILYKGDNFLVVSKAAPYSEEDFMVIYSGKDSNKTSIINFDSIEKGELFELLEFINNKLLIDYDKELQNGNKELIIGINTSFIPGNGNIQSVSRPHFHFTLLSNKEQFINNVKTETINILKTDSEHVSRFCIREINDFLINKLIYELDNSIGSNLNYTKSDIGCIDFDLLDNENLFSKSNINMIESVYNFVYYVSQKKFSLYKLVNHDKNSFSMGFKKINGIYKLRIRYFHKNPGDAGGIMESFNHLIVRNRVENPLLPNMEEFNKRIFSYF